MNNPPATVILTQTAADVAPVASATPAAPPIVTQMPKVLAGEAATRTDARGRRITVKRLDPIQLYRLTKMMGQAANSEASVNLAMLAAAVREIDGAPEPFPTNESQIEAMLQRLGFDGIDAAAEALAESVAGSQPDRTTAKN